MGPASREVIRKQFRLWMGLCVPPQWLQPSLMRTLSLVCFMLLPIVGRIKCRLRSLSETTLVPNCIAPVFGRGTKRKPELRSL